MGGETHKKAKNVYTTVVKYLCSDYQTVFVCNSLPSPLEKARDCITNFRIPRAWHTEGTKC